jgi:hypothetical protein
MIFMSHASGHIYKQTDSFDYRKGVDGRAVKAFDQGSNSTERVFESRSTHNFLHVKTSDDIMMTRVEI